MVGWNKKAIFNYLKDRIWKKCQSWSAKYLSRAGKEVLIKSVAQEIPSYCMGAFLIPTSLCEEIERTMNSFYWGSKRNGSRGINWMRWDKLSLHKSRGGLGFRDMEILFHFFDRLSTAQRSMASMILWSLWKNRNSKLWENSDSPPQPLFKERKTPSTNGGICNNTSTVFRFCSTRFYGPSLHPRTWNAMWIVRCSTTTQ